MFRKIILSAVVQSLLVWPIGVSANNTDTSATFNSRSLTVESALSAAKAALMTCRKSGYSVAVAVVDRGGNVQVLLRDRFAGPHTPETARRKAWTAVSFRQSTGDLAAFLQNGDLPNQVQHNPGALLVGGGELIQAGGELIAAIGVSGAPPGKSEKDSIDGACALAGIKAIEEALAFE